LEAIEILGATLEAMLGLALAVTLGPILVLILVCLLHLSGLIWVHLLELT
jgi:hypothetical protein